MSISARPAKPPKRSFAETQRKFKAKGNSTYSKNFVRSSG